jgi:radical SAM protein with 4Fe4S-binding SPASM domain
MASVIVKVTEACNSRCLYCDVVRKQSSGATLPLALFDTLLCRADEYLRQFPNETVELIWHGGEPLMVGPDYLAAVADLTARRCGQTRGRLRHSMQTNLTLFSEKFIGPLRALGIGALGTSFDPLPNVRGPGEQPDSDWYNARFFSAVELLERHGFAWGMIYVVTRRSLEDPLGLFHWLVNLNMTSGLNLNPVLIYGDDQKDLAITPEEFVGFLGAIFPHWWEHRSRYTSVEPFSSMVTNIIDGGKALGCVYAGDCTYGHVNVAPDGRTSQCGRSGDWNLLDYGHIADRTLDEILHDAQRRELEARQSLLPTTECRDCRLWQLCHGGCPLDAWSKHKSFGHKSEWCEAQRGFIEKVFEPTTGVRYRPNGL